MTLCPRDEELLDLVSGRVGPTMLAVETHFESCTACQARISTLEQKPDSVVVALRKVVDRGAETVVSMAIAAQDVTALTRTAPHIGKNIQEELADLARHWEPPAGPGEIGRLGRYILRDLLGAGGMGVVLRAEDTLLHRQVALKVVRPRLVESSDARSRFLRESQAMAAMTSEHVIPIYDGGQHGSLMYYTMPLLSGEPLDALIRRERTVAPERLRTIALDIAKGLAVVHARGVVHRDLKPSNVWLDADTGRARLLDFGLARLMNNEGTQITSSDMIAGTPSFMAPEQARGQPVTPQSDLFSLGCVLYAMATGQSPFKGPDLLAVLSALASLTPAPLRNVNPQVSPRLSRLVEELLAKDPERRPASANEVIRRLTEPDAAPSPSAVSFPRGAVAGGVLAVVAGFASWWFWPPSKTTPLDGGIPTVRDTAPIPTSPATETIPSAAAAPSATSPPGEAAPGKVAEKSSAKTSAAEDPPPPPAPPPAPAPLPYFAESSRYGVGQPVTFATFPNLRVEPAANYVTLGLEGEARTTMPVFRKVPVGGWNHTIASRVRVRGGVNLSFYVRMQPRPGAAWFDRDFAELKLKPDGGWFLDRTFNSATEQVKQRLAGGTTSDPEIPIGERWVDVELQGLGDRLRVLADGQLLADVADPVPAPTGPVVHPFVAEFKYDANSSPPDARPEMDVANLEVRDDTWTPGPGWMEVARDSHAVVPELVSDFNVPNQFRRRSANGLLTLESFPTTPQHSILLAMTRVPHPRLAVSCRVRTNPGSSLTWMVRNRVTSDNDPWVWDHFTMEIDPLGRWLVNRSVDRAATLPKHLIPLGSGQCRAAHDDQWHNAEIVADTRRFMMRWDGEVLFDLTDPHPPRIDAAHRYDVRLMSLQFPGRQGRIELDEWRVWSQPFEAE
jgi:serine/threonine protein kinase